MIKKSSKTEEYDHFVNLANEWWNPQGKFRILHSITPVRIKYILDTLIKNKSIVRNKKKPLLSYKILDLGCGGGLVCEPLSRLGGKLTGIDFVKKNIEVAKYHSKISKLKIDYIHKDLEKLSFKTKFDVILILEVLEHTDDWKSILKKISKFLKPNGKLIVSTINRNLLAKVFAIFFAENILNWVPKRTHNYEKFIKPEELSLFLSKINFREINTTGLVYKPILNEWHLDLNKNRINYFCSAVKN